MGARLIRHLGRRRLAGVLLISALVAGYALALPRLIALLVVDRVNLPRFDTPTLPYRPITFRSGGVALSGWLFEPVGTPRGLVVHLHGRMYTRVGGIATADVLVPRGYAVLTFDLRAHGESEGEHCTYGKLEKEDVARAIDAVGISPVYVIGHSLGAAVALQAAADDPRIRAVVAASCFADLHTAIDGRFERWPLVTPATVQAAERLAEEKAGFHFAEVSPLAAAGRLQVPVLLVHGTLDTDTPPEASESLLAALHGHGRLYLARGADHTEILDDPSAPVWGEIAGFLDGLGPAADAGR